MGEERRTGEEMGKGEGERREEQWDSGEST
jgi:hypothetical protein